MTFMELLAEFVLGRPDDREDLVEDLDLEAPGLKFFAVCEDVLIIKVFGETA